MIVLGEPAKDFDRQRTSASASGAPHDPGGRWDAMNNVNAQTQEDADALAQAHAQAASQAEAQALAQDIIDGEAMGIAGGEDGEGDG